MSSYPIILLIDSYMYIYYPNYCGQYSYDDNTLCSISAVVVVVIVVLIIVIVTADLLVVQFQRRKILPRLGELALLHTFPHKPDIFTVTDFKISG